MITCHRKYLEQRCLERGRDLAAAMPCVVAMEGDMWTVDVDHASYPRPDFKTLSFKCVPDCLTPQFSCNSGFCCEENPFDGTNSCVPCSSSSSGGYCCVNCGIAAEHSTQEDCERCETINYCEEYLFQEDPEQPCPEGWYGGGGYCYRFTTPGSCSECSGSCYSDTNGPCGTWNPGVPGENACNSTYCLQPFTFPFDSPCVLLGTLDVGNEPIPGYQDNVVPDVQSNGLKVEYRETEDNFYTISSWMSYQSPNLFAIPAEGWNAGYPQKLINSKCDIILAEDRTQMNFPMPGPVEGCLHRYLWVRLRILVADCESKTISDVTGEALVGGEPYYYRLTFSSQGCVPPPPEETPNPEGYISFLPNFSCKTS